MIDVRLFVDKRSVSKRGWPLKFLFWWNKNRFFVSKGYFVTYDLENGELFSTISGVRTPPQGGVT